MSEAESSNSEGSAEKRMLEVAVVSEQERYV